MAILKKVTLLLFALQLSGTGFSQQLQPARLLEDLAYFKDTLPVKHKNLFAKVSRTVFENKVAAIAANINNLGIESFVAELFKLNVAIGDEHTNLFLPYPLRFPLQVELFDEGAAILGTDSAHSNLMLSRIIAIDGMPANEIDRKFAEAIKQDNPSFFKVWKTYYYNNPFFLKGLGIITNSTSATFTTVSALGDTVNTVLTAVAPDKMSGLVNAGDKTPLPYQSHSNKNYWYQFTNNGTILYFNYLRCKNDDAENFDQFNQQLFKDIAALKPKKIIVDLRFNSGGNSGVLQPFIDSIQNSYLNKKKHLFVLIGKTTFSSAVMNAVYLKRNTKAILVGSEPTGGSVNHYGEVRGFYLPNTKIEVAYSTRYWENWKGYKGGLRPDMKVQHRLEKFAGGKDEALEYVQDR